MVNQLSPNNIASQLVLDLGHRPALSEEDFFVSPCNELAVGWVDCWPNWPSSILIIVGKPGSGKSHLASVWSALSGATSIQAADLEESGDPWKWMKPSPACVVEGLAEEFNDHALLHLLNAASEIEGHVLLTANTPPSQWSVKLADLLSRVKAAPVTTLNEPDDSLLAAIILKLFSDRQLDVAPEVIHYIVPRIERTFDSARKLVTALDRAALTESRAVTIPLVRRFISTT